MSEASFNQKFIQQNFPDRGIQFTSKGLTPDESAATLSHSSMLLNQMLGTPKTDFSPQIDSSQPQGGPETPQEPESMQENKNEPQEQPDTSKLESKITDLETSHEKEIALLRAEIGKSNMKQEYEAKIKAIEDAHAKQISDIKDEIKSIVNG